MHAKVTINIMMWETLQSTWSCWPAAALSSLSNVVAAHTNNNTEQATCPQNFSSAAFTSMWQNLQPQCPDLFSFVVYIVLLFGGFSIFIQLADAKESIITHWWNKPKLLVRGKHLDEFDEFDNFCRKWNNVLGIVCIFLGVKCACMDPNMLWDFGDLSVMSTLLPIPLYLVCYDFLYTTTHMALHLKGIYAYIHKHHHRQKAPSRGSQDAINVHPVEYVSGHLNSIVAAWMVGRILPFHVLGSCLGQVILTGASCFNHARHDVSLCIAGWTLWAARDHDMHHRCPTKNFGRVIMLWDWIFGTYKAFDYDEPARPQDEQLDPTTGKSFRYMKQQQRQAHSAKDE